MLVMKRRRLAVQVIGCPRADGARVSSNRRWNKCLLMEVQHTKPVGDEVQASKEEGLGWLEDEWNPHPDGQGCGKLQRAKVNCIARARHGGGGGKMGHPMTKKC